MTRLLDEDTAEVVALLKEALADSGLSQAAFARALGTSPARLSTHLSGQTRPSAYFVVRARRLGRALGGAARSGLMSAPVTAAAIRTSLQAGDTDWAWRMLLQGRDHLQLMFAEPVFYAGLVASWEAEPGSVGDARWDTLLAAVTGHEFEQARHETPEWASHIERLGEPWLPEHPFLDHRRVRAQTPAWLRRLNIFVPQRDLVTA